jgi:TP901 family phage tail tape measure protein
VASNETSRLAIILSTQGVDRAVSDLQRFERAAQEAKRATAAGPTSSILANSPNAATADQNLEQRFRNNRQYLDAYNKALAAGGQETAKQYRALEKSLDANIKRIDTLAQAGRQVFSGRPTSDLYAETAQLRAAGFAGALTRNEAGKFVGTLSGKPVTEPASTRAAAAERLRQAELEREIQRGEILTAQMAGLTTATRFLQETTQAQALQQQRNAAADRAQAEAAKELERAERARAAQLRRQAAREAGIAYSATNVEPITQRSPFRPPPVEGLSTLFVTDKDGNIVGTSQDYGPESATGGATTDAARLKQAGEYAREQTNLQRVQVNEEALRIERRALDRLRASDRGTITGASTGEIGRAYLDELAAARPDLEARGLFNDVAPALDKYARAATRGAEQYDRMTERVHSLEETSRLQQSLVAGRGPLGQRVGNFAVDFQQGFRGRRDLPFGEQLGQVAKFSLFYGAAYGALYKLSQGIQSAIDNSIEYNAAIIELSISSGQSTEAVSGLAESLGNLSARYGFAPSEGVQAGSRAIGIFGLNDAPAPEQGYYARAFTEATAQLAFVTGRTFEQVGQDLGAITQGFGLNAASVGYVQDLDAYFAKQFGSVAGGTLETTAQIGSLGQEAGFSLEEVSALASLLQSRTGQTPAATAGFLSQFFGRAGDPALRQKFAEIGIDISVPFRDQIEQLSNLLSSNELGEGLRLEIINAFGRGRSGQAAAIIGQEFPTVAEKAAAAETEAAGAGQKQFEERLASVGGQLRQFSGVMLLLLKNVGESGLLSAFGLLLKTATALAEGANAVLGAFNLIPSEIRNVIGAMIAWRIAMRTDIGRAAVASVLGATSRGAIFAEQVGLPVAGAVPRLRSGEAALRGQPQQLALFGAGTEAGAAGRLTGAAAVRAGASAALASSLALLSNPVTLAIGGLLAIGALKGQMDNLAAAASDATASLSTGATNDPELLRQDAKALRDQAAKTEDVDGLLANLVGLGDLYGFNNKKPSEYAAQQRARADQLEQQAQEIEDFYGSMAQLGSSDIFGAVTNVDEVATGLQELAAAGASPAEQFNLLTRAIRASGRAASQTAEDFTLLPGKVDRALKSATGEVSKEALFYQEDPNLTPEENARRKAAATASQGGLLGTDLFATTLDSIGRGDQTGLVPEISNPYTDADLQQKLQDRFDEVNVQAGVQALADSAGKIDPDAVKKYVEEEVIGGIDFSNVGGFELSGAEQDALSELLAKFYGDALVETLAQFDPNQVYNATTFTRQLNENLLPAFQAKLAQLQTEGFTEGSTRYEQVIKRQIATLKSTRFEGDFKPSQYFAALRDAEAQLAASVITRLEGIREARQEQAKTAQQFRQIGRRLLRREFNNALESRSLALIKDVISRSSDRVVGLVRDQLLVELEAARSAFAAAQKAIEYVKIGRRLVRTADRAAYKALRAAGRELRKLQEEFDLFKEARGTTAATGSALQPPADLTDQPEEDTGPTAAQIAAARAIAEATRRGGQIDLATAELQSARADLAAAESGTVEYYQALAAVYEAQRSLAEAIRADRINQFLLANDITDPVVQAQAQLKAARQKLRYDQRQGASPELIREDRLAVEQEQANKESAKFSQWLSDLQTAENLERISHAAYIRHLERRQERLQAIKHRTRQEQDQLDQVEGALKAARDALSAQFNLGDIKVPTPYEVRRYIEQTAQAAKDKAGSSAAGGSGPRTPANGTSNQLNTINNDVKIDGADTAQIIRILRDILGNHAIRSTATATGKRG